jgi:hypothetical protein
VGYAVRRFLSHARCAKLRAYLAAANGVTEERLLEVVEQRRRFRRARRERARSRQRWPADNPMPMKQFKRKHAGEGDLHELLREAGLSYKDFCAMIPIDQAIFHRWYGHPLHPWPVRLLEQFIWARNMAAKLKELGIDPEQFKKKGLPPTLGFGRAMNKEQGEAMIKKLKQAGTR